MKKGVTFAMIFTGTILSAFVINIALFAMVPEYHDALVAAVSTSRIPVVRADQSMEIDGAVIKAVPVSTVNTSNNESFVNGINVNDSFLNGNELIGNALSGNASNGNAVNENSDSKDSTHEQLLIPEDVLLDYESTITPLAASPDASTEKKAVIVDKEYHEDCGTGKGYWVITYSDGSTVIE
ncbi:MAG: hypothetical protein K6E91_00450 [Butyrivibrio sp.]|nr:hypothetical protein [Butyrivibrio sp.]